MYKKQYLLKEKQIIKLDFQQFNVKEKILKKTRDNFIISGFL
jgi:hypothetical protein